MIILTFDYLPISVNRLYVNLRNQSRRFLSSEGKKFKEEVSQDISSQLSIQQQRILSDYTDKKLAVDIIIVSPNWLTKKGASKKIDLDNKAKILLDSIFTEFRFVNPNLDDSQIWKLNLEKQYDSVMIKTIVKISEYSEK